MTKQEFTTFIEISLDELKLVADTYAYKTLPDIESFQWSRQGEPIHTGKKNIVKAILDEVYIEFDQIYPCVDLTVDYNSDKTHLLVKGFRADYTPRPFQKGWSNRRGPFIYGIVESLHSPNLDINSNSFQKNLFDLGLRHKS